MIGCLSQISLIARTATPSSTTTSGIFLWRRQKVSTHELSPARKCGSPRPTLGLDALETAVAQASGSAVPLHGAIRRPTAPSSSFPRREIAGRQGALRLIHNFPLPSGCEYVRLGGSFTSEQRDGRDQNIVNKSRFDTSLKTHIQPLASRQIPHFSPTFLFEEPHFIANILQHFIEFAAFSL